MFRIANRFLFRQYLVRNPSESFIKAPMQTIPAFSGDVFIPQPAKYEITKLPNGLVVMTESVTVPSVVDLGILVKAGSRDQTIESSGATHLLKNSFLKTGLNTNETINYAVYQMSGGQLDCDYTREVIYYQASCLAHDVTDLFTVATDCAFEPKNIIAVSVGMSRNSDAHKLEGALGYNITFNDHIHQAAYGLNTLGMPLLGRKKNVNNLLTDVVQNFQQNILSPDRIIIAAAGIQNHQEFLALVNEKMATNILPNKSVKREKAVYLGGEIKQLTEANTIHLAFAFEAGNLSNCLPYLIASEVLNENRRLGRIKKNVLKNVFVDDAQVLQVSYSDSGLFGLKISGSASHAKEIAQVAAKELNGLKKITQQQFDLAKGSLKGTLNRADLHSSKRLQERVKSIAYYGKLIENASPWVDTVTLADVQKAVAKMFESKLTFVARGGQVQRLPSYDVLSKHFK